MCTLTFIPSNSEFLVAMNRDELHTRPAATPPRIFDLDGMNVIFPREAGGGTWIGCNDAGNLLALLNWYIEAGRVPAEVRQTRGLIIPTLISERSSPDVAARFKRLDLRTVLPFRLIGVFRSEGRVHEWRWDGTQSAQVEHPWARSHWFSSSVSDARASEERVRAVESGVRTSSALDEAWLRQIHSSHSPAPGPFSICVHRPDASTVSYTMVRCADNSISMGYLEGSPCRRDGLDALFIVPLKLARVTAARA